MLQATIALRNYVVALSRPARSKIARRRHSLSLTLLTVAGIIFRSELAVLVASQTIYLLLTRRITFRSVIPAGIVGVVIGLLVTVPIDSFFWQKYPLWPEWVGFYYNTILGKSSDWGTSPWYYYFANSIPKLLFNPLILTLLIPTALISPSSRQLSIDLLVPSLTFVSIYSILPHKEWRFITYIIPLLTAVGSTGASWIWTRRTKSAVYRALSLLLLGSAAATLIASALMLSISSLNYPGGEAITRLHRLTRNEDSAPLRIYADNLACQTGVTRFLENRFERVQGESGGSRQQKYTFDKTEGVDADYAAGADGVEGGRQIHSSSLRLLDPLFWRQFDYALVEHQERVIGAWEVVGVVAAYDGIKLLRPGMMKTNEEHGHVHGHGLGLASTGSEVDDLLLLNDGNQRQDVWYWWDQLGTFARATVTRGWWISVRVVPKIKILKRIKE